MRMSLVAHMHQRRTVASGRHDSENELTPKKFSADVERSNNTTGRGRMKEQAAGNSPVGMNTFIPGNKLLGGSNATDVNEENKLSLKRRSVDEASLNNCEEEEPEVDCSNWGSNNNVNVYTKRLKSIPSTPPLRLIFRRREASLPPGFEYLREVESPMASEQVVEFDDEVLDGQPPSPIITEYDSDPYGYNSIRSDFEEVLQNDVAESPPLEESSTATVLWSEPETPVHEPFSYFPLSPRKSHGLVNLGNTCYMNVIIQCLYNLPSFVSGMERFFGGLVKRDAFEDTSNVEELGTLYAALLEVFRSLKQCERYESVNPYVLKHTFAKRQESFWGTIQQDAHEFFCSLIDKIQEEVEVELKNRYSNEADRPKLEAVCPTTQNFSCLVRNNLTCAGCGNATVVKGTDRYFCLGLPEDEREDESQNCSVESLLDLYFQETTMSRKCEKCGTEETKSQNQILKLPHVLVLQLKRLHMDRDGPCMKVTTPVKYSPRLDIGPWCAEDRQKFWSPSTDEDSSNDSVASSCTTLSNGSVDWGSYTSGIDEFGTLASGVNLESPDSLKVDGSVSTSYRLYGVVNHIGFSDTAGHFLTDVLDADSDRWLRCDDSVVFDLNMPEESVFVNEREAYMFFYVHES